ncbi:MAG: hypothetical protein U5O39_20780 [Gammaproteobacteria bacterium]|nr:hypothetical protein [Gammaproteobacteria bacterium]
MTDLVREHTYSDQDMRAIRKVLLDRAGEGEYHDFTNAEQAFLAVETLSIELDEYERLGASLDAWFDTVSDEHDFSPGRFSTVARQVRASTQ